MRLIYLPLLILAMTALGCAGDPGPTAGSVPPDAHASTTPAMSPTASPSSDPSRDAGSGSVIVTFRTAGDEEFRILLTDAEDIQMASRLLSGDEERPLFPNGQVVRGDDGGVNTGYSWHIDPESVEFAEFTMEACDGRPSYVEDGSHTSERFCPWSAVVVAIDPAR